MSAGARSRAGYSTREVARMLELPETRVRSFVQAGILEPAAGSRGAYRFSFQDLVVLKAAKELADAGASSRRIRRALTDLAEALPRGRSLAEVRIGIEGGQVVVREGDTSWEPESGQLRLDFEVAELAARAAPFAPKAIARAERLEDLGADDWYELAFDLEASSPGQAEAAYSRALELDPGYAPALLNLGRLLHQEGRLQESEALFREALELVPAEGVAAYNLGVALQDLGRMSEAIAAYRQAVAADPQLPEAHFNLAGLLEEAGDRQAALRHLTAYRRLRPPRP